MLEQVVGGKFDFLVPPLRRPVTTGDQAHPVETPKVPEDEGVSSLGPVRGTLSEAKMPSGVLVPIVVLEVGVLVVGAGLGISPIAFQQY